MGSRLSRSFFAPRALHWPGPLYDGFQRLEPFLRLPAHGKEPTVKT